MKFEFDTRKSVANEAKQGINFEEAKMIWNDPLQIVAEANTKDEKRILTTGIGQLSGPRGVRMTRSSRLFPCGGPEIRRYEKINESN